MLKNWYVFFQNFLCFFMYLHTCLGKVLNTSVEKWGQEVLENSYLRRQEKCTYSCIHNYICVCVYVHVFMCKHVQCMCVFSCVYMCMWMYMCMHIYVSVYVHLCILLCDIYVYVYMYLYMYAYVYLYVCMFVMGMYVYISVCYYVSVYMCICAYVYMHMHVCSLFVYYICIFIVSLKSVFGKLFHQRKAFFLIWQRICGSSPLRLDSRVVAGVFLSSLWSENLAFCLSHYLLFFISTPFSMPGNWCLKPLPAIINFD